MRLAAFLCSSFLLVACSRSQAPATAARSSSAVKLGEQRVTVSDGTELYAKVAGTGPACIVVHGGPGQGTLSFEKMGADALESFLTIVYLDQRGSGRSQNAANYHLDRVVQDIEDVRRSLGIEKVCLIAHSFGGILAVNYAKRYPQRVSRLILSNILLEFFGMRNVKMQIDFVNRTLGKQVVELPANADRGAIRDARDRARTALMKSGQGYRFIVERVETIGKMSELDQSYDRAREYGATVVTKPDTVPEYMIDYAPITAEIEAPTLVIAGRADWAVGPDEHTHFRFPDQKVVVLDGAHLPYYEKNAEWTAAIRAFMIGR